MRIGIVNLMPDTVAYHEELAGALDCVAQRVQLSWLQLRTRPLPADVAAFVAQRYTTIKDVAAELDGLIITGAPLELVDFDEVGYWDELRAMIGAAIAGNVHTFGICWGALAIGRVLGLRKTVIEKKVSGVFATANAACELSPFVRFPETLTLPFSIRAHFDTGDVNEQLGTGRLCAVATLDSLPHAFIHTADNRHFMCLGHPEYGPNRLLNEWHRDRKKDPETKPPCGVDLTNPQAVWRGLANSIFELWVDRIAAKIAARSRAAAIAGMQRADRPRPQFTEQALQ
jgi:homoserine O-succinyltransferase